MTKIITQNEMKLLLLRVYNLYKVSSLNIQKISRLSLYHFYSLKSGIQHNINTEKGIQLLPYICLATKKDI